MSYRRGPAPGEYKFDYEAVAKTKGRGPGASAACKLINQNNTAILLKDWEAKDYDQFLQDLDAIEHVGQPMQIKKGGPGEMLSRMHALAWNAPEVAHELLCFVQHLARQQLAARAKLGKV